MNIIRKKQYILNEGDKIDFLIELGLMSVEGKILKSSFNKFKQINKIFRIYWWCHWRVKKPKNL